MGAEPPVIGHEFTAVPAQPGNRCTAIGTERIAFFENAVAAGAGDFNGVLRAENTQYLFAGRETGIDFSDGILQQGGHPGLPGASHQFAL